MPVLSAKPDRYPLLRLLGPGLRRAVLRHYTPNSCVASTAIALRVLSELEIPAAPLSVEAHIFNAAFLRCASREGRLPHSVEERERWFREEGAHGLGLGLFDPNADMPPYFNGLHVVVFVDGRWLWDLSIDQATRPQHGILLERPLLAEIPAKSRNWLRGGQAASFEGPNGILVTYKARPKDQRFWEHPNGKPDGRDVEVRDVVAQEALMALRGLYENPTQLPAL